MVRPAVSDPVELGDSLWKGFAGRYGWDVGANCGQSVVPMVMRFAKVTCFEPCAESCAYLRSWFGGDVAQLALSDHDGELELALPPGEQAETGQLVTPGTPGMEWSPADWSACPKVTVPCRTADSLAAELGRPDFMKVDTEGHEVQVLRGAREIVADRRTGFLIEFHSEENFLWCQLALEKAGYRIEVVRHPHYPERSPLWFGHGWLRGFPAG